MYRMRRITITVISLLFMGALVACGDDDEATTPAQGDDTSGNATAPPPDRDGDTATDENSGSANGETPSGAAGTVTADGQTHRFERVVNCEPPDAGIPDHEARLAVSALGEDGIALHVRLESFGDLDAQSLDWFGPDGVFNGGATQVGDGWLDTAEVSTPEPPLTITDDRITGVVTVVNTRATDESMELTIDVPYPSETISC
jgi:hypothetical protein